MSFYFLSLWFDWSKPVASCLVAVERLRTENFSKNGHCFLWVAKFILQLWPFLRNMLSKFHVFISGQKATDRKEAPPSVLKEAELLGFTCSCILSSSSGCRLPPPPVLSPSWPMWSIDQLLIWSSCLGFSHHRSNSPVCQQNNSSTIRRCKPSLNWLVLSVRQLVSVCDVCTRTRRVSCLCPVFLLC